MIYFIAGFLAGIFMAFYLKPWTDKYLDDRKKTHKI